MTVLGINEAEALARAKQLARRSPAQLSLSLQPVGKRVQNVARWLGTELKPTVTLAAALAGAVAVIGVTVVLARRGKRRHRWLVSLQPLPLAGLAKSAGLWALRFVAQRATHELMTRLAEPAASAGSRTLVRIVQRRPTPAQGGPTATME